MLVTVRVGGAGADVDPEARAGGAHGEAADAALEVGLEGDLRGVGGARGGVVVAIELEVSAGGGGYARCAFGGVEGDAAREDGLEARDLNVDAGAADLYAETGDVPEMGAFLHEAVVRSVDENLDVDGTRAVAEVVAEHLAHLDVPVEHGGARAERAEADGGQGEGAAGLAGADRGGLL